MVEKTERQQSCLALRSLPIICLAFVGGPMLGLSLVWFAILWPASLSAMWADSQGLYRESYLLFLLFGGWLCLVVEVGFVAPLLIGFHRYRWRWLNGWTGAAFGAAMGMLPFLILHILAWPTTSAEWASALNSFLQGGVVGLIAAVAFRVTAVRTITPADSDA